MIMPCVVFCNVLKTLQRLHAASPPGHRSSPPAVRQLEALRGGCMELAGAGGKVTPPAKCSRITIPMRAC